MKKIIFTLLAFVGTMSLNAQVVKVMNNEQIVAVFTADQANNVVFEETPFGQGYAAATGIGYVKWVQLWENGPKFAEYNVCAKSATEYGGYYAWGGSKDKVADQNTGTDALSGTDDTATKLWGGNWRMPTQAELNALLNNENCTCTWAVQNDVNGLLCRGKEGTDYASNSVFLPAAGYCYLGGVSDQGDYGGYWSSTPAGSRRYAYYLYFLSGGQYVADCDRDCGYSIRAVLAEE